MRQREKKRKKIEVTLVHSAGRTACVHRSHSCFTCLKGFLKNSAVLHPPPHTAHKEGPTQTPEKSVHSCPEHTRPLSQRFVWLQNRRHATVRPFNLPRSLSNAGSVG